MFIFLVINIYKKEKYIKMANIKNNNYRKIDCRIINDEYIDLMLSKDDVKTNILSDDCVATLINFNSINSKNVISETSWVKSVPSNKILTNIGYTGVDNGFISYERDRIGNDEFLELYTNSKFDLATFSDKFFLTEVNGNTGMFTYPIEKNDEYVSLKGGFYQGFFKIDGDIYQTLPYRIKDEWNFNITLRPQNYTTSSNILNKRHLNNEGIFFFIGSRSENKFWELYKSNDIMQDYILDGNDDYSIDYDMIDSNVIKRQYINNTIDEPEIDNENNEDEDYFAEGFNPYDEENLIHNHDTDYFIDDYQNNNCITNGIISHCADGIFEDDYIMKQIDLSDIKLSDSKNNPIGEKGFYEIKTNNKFIIFNQTAEGYTKNTWNNMYEFILTGKTDSPSINYYPYLNRTNTGDTKNNIQKLIEEHSYNYDIFKDIENNAFALKLNNDGSISYRYLSNNCELIEETSNPGLIKNGEWYNIHLKMKRKQSYECDDYATQSVMQIFIYINGYLKLVSKELPELMLKPLNDNSERQEGVPYSLSIGGGSQGLCERVLLDYYDITDYLLPIEKNFAGTFIGDIKKFTFIPCPIDFSIISVNNGGF